MKKEKEFQTEDGYLMTYLHSVKAVNLEEVFEKTKGALEVGLRSLVIPTNIEVHKYRGGYRYDIHLYKAEKIQEGQ